MGLCRSRLKPGGTFVCFALNGANPITGAEALLQNFDQCSTLTEYTMTQVLKNAGFADIDVFGLNLYVYYSNPGNYLAMAAAGLKDLVVVEDRDAVLVTHKDQTQDVKQFVDQLKSKGREKTNLHRQVFRPWRSYDLTDSDDGCQIRRLIVNPSAALSLRKHARRVEH